MKRILLIAALVLAPAAFAQEHKDAGKQAGESSPGEAEKPIWGLPKITWTTLNFAILALGLGYMIGKAAPPFFQGRTREIQSAIRDAAAAKQEADARVAEIERKLATLGGEIERVRLESKKEMEAEANRTREETGRAIEKVQAHAEQEIASAAKHAREELQAYSAQLALDLAEERIKSRMNQPVQDALVRGFVDGLARHRVHRENN